MAQVSRHTSEHVNVKMFLMMQIPSYTHRTLGLNFTKGYQYFLALFTVTTIQSIRKVLKVETPKQSMESNRKIKAQTGQKREKLS